MDVCEHLERDFWRRARGSYPSAWIADPRLGGFDSVAGVVSAARKLNDDSDRVVSGLLLRGGSDQLATSALIVAMLPLLLRRCQKRRDLVDELVGELTMVVGDIRAHGLPPNDRRLVSLLIDRAWDRLRTQVERSSRTVVVDPAEVVLADSSPGADPERVAINRVALEGFREELTRSAPSRRSEVAAWNSAVELVDREDRTSSERDRWKYARRQLRRHASRDLAA